MPTLPNLPEIPPGPVWDRIYAAFDGDPAAYRAWLKQKIKERVLQREANLQRISLEDDITTMMDNLGG